MKTRFTLILSLILPLAIQAEPVTNELILTELKKLNANLERMEERLDEIDQRVEGLGTPRAIAVTEAGPPSPTFVDRMVEAVQLRQESVRYPWMDAELWTHVKVEMSQEEVIAILGKPTLEDPSLYKRIDIVYTYRGRRPMTGELVLGKVKFYRDKVIAIEVP
jgi:hypothetical protein